MFILMSGRDYRAKRKVARKQPDGLPTVAAGFNQTPTCLLFSRADGPPNDGETSESSRHRLSEGGEVDAKAAITSHPWKAAEPVRRNTVRLASARSDSSCWTAGGRVTSTTEHHHLDTREEDSATFKGVTAKESPPMQEAWRSRASPRASPAALSPKLFQPLQHSSRQQADTGTCTALTTDSNRPFSDVGAGPTQPEDDFKEGSTTEPVCDASLSSNDSGLDEDSRSNEAGGGGHLHVEDALSGGHETRSSPGFQPPAEDMVDERGSDRDVDQHKSTLACRGTKRQSTADVTLAQVIDHHMARRRLNGVDSDRERVRVEEHSSYARASSGEHMASAEHVRSENHHNLNGKWPPASATQRSRLDSSAVVAAAWTNGCVLPLTEALAPHMRLVAPVLAAEPEGRRVVVHTAAAVTAGAAILALPEHRLEVTGTCRDGLLLELHPKEEGVRGSYSLDQKEESAFLSAYAERLQTAFDGLVKLDLEFDMVRLPHGEAVDIMGTDSSSSELMQWLNEDTTSLVRLSAPRAPPPTGTPSTDQAPRGGDLIELRKELAHSSAAPFLGIDCNLWPLLPRTGLLESFGVNIHRVVLPPPEPTRGESRAHRSVIHLAVTLSDSGTSLGSGSGSLGGLHGGGCQFTRSLPGLQVAGARGTSGSVVTSDAAAIDHPQPDDSPLRCAPPTCTVGGLTWRQVTGLRCVAAVNKLALGSRKQREGKLQLAEGLHTAEVGGILYSSGQ